jgi:preprotein translocase subunit SecA
VPIEAKMVTNAIASAQSQVEAQNFEIRKNVLKYDDVMNRQRTVIYEERRRVLEGADLAEQIRHMIDDTVEGYVRAETSDGYPEEWDLDRLWTALKTLYPVGLTIEQLDEESGGGRAGLTSDFLVERLVADAQAAYDRREADLGPEVTRELERRVVLSVLDRKWREHLYEMDYLKEGIGLRAMAQRDPLVEYQREGYELFAAMMDGIKEESVGYVFHLEVNVEEPAAAPEVGAAPVEVAALLGEPSAESAAPAPAAPAKSAEEVVAAMAGRGQPRIQAKGLEAHRPQRMAYSAPSETGGVAERSEAGGDEAVEVGPDASRAERRRAERESKKRRR